MIEIPRKKQQSESKEEEVEENVEKVKEELVEQLLEDVTEGNDEHDDEDGYDSIDEPLYDENEIPNEEGKEEEEEENKSISSPILEQEIVKEIDQKLSPIIKEENNLAAVTPLNSEETEHLTEDELESIIDDSVPENLEVIESEIQSDFTPPIIEESNTVISNEPTTTALEVINSERKFEKRLNSISFLVEFTKGTWRRVDEVADKIGISTKTGNLYLREYIETVKNSINDKSYPDGVLSHYNHGIDDENKKIKYHHLDKLKELVKRYSKYDVTANLNKTLNNNGSDTFISNKRVALDDNNSLSLLGGKQQSTPIINEPSISNDIDHLQDGITALQLIRFGLVQVFGQTAKMKIGLLLGENPTPYLMDEQKMKKLLVMSGATESRAEYFIDWLKTNAHYVAHPQGFLIYGAMGSPSPGSNTGYNGNPQQSSNYGNNFGPDPMTDYYYQTGVYMRGFAPDHPINIQALKEHKEQKRADDEMKAFDKRFTMFIRTKMMDSFQDMGSSKNQSSLFSPEMMLMLGIGQYRQTGTDPDGKPIFGIVPNFGAFGGGMGGQGQQSTTSSTDQMTSMMAMMKEMMGFMASMNKADPAQQNFMATIMSGLASKLIEPQTNKAHELLETAKLLQELKGPQVPVAQMGGITDPEVLIKTKRMELDKDFGMRKLDLQQQELNLQRDRLAAQDREANANLEKIMEGITSFAPSLLGMVQQFFMGNRGQTAGAEGQGQPQVQRNPAEVILKMEYEKQRQQAALEAERKRMEWEAELKRKNVEYETTVSQPYRPPVQQQQPETEKVIIKEPTVVVQQQRPREPERYTEETFLPYSPGELESVLIKAQKEKKKLDEYIATVGTVLQNKILNGEGDNQEEEYETVETEEPQQINPSDNPIVAKEEQQDFTQILDNYPSDMIDPDYSGPSDEGEEEIENIEDKQQEEESVDIN